MTAGELITYASMRVRARKRIAPHKSADSARGGATAVMAVVACRPPPPGTTGRAHRLLLCSLTRCPTCATTARPAVLSFFLSLSLFAAAEGGGEKHPDDLSPRGREKAQHHISRRLPRRCARTDVGEGGW